MRAVAVAVALCLLVVASPSQAGEFPWPCAYNSFGQQFVSGNKTYAVHRGLDLMNNIGTPVYSVSSGTVHLYVASGGGLGGCPDKNKGQILVVKHVSGGTTLYFAYLHIKNVPTELRSAGQPVSQGAKIAEIADFDPCCAGTGSCPHLHFGVWVGTNPDFPLSGWGRSEKQLGWDDPVNYLSGAAPDPPPPPPPPVTYKGQIWTQDPYVIDLAQGQTATFIATFKNQGSGTWKGGATSQTDPDYIELRSCSSSGTTQSSWLCPGTGSGQWISTSRVATCTEGSVSNPNSATFTFTVKVPIGKPPGSYRQYFRLHHNTGGDLLTKDGFYDGYYVTVHVQPAYGLILRNPATAQWWERYSVRDAFAFPSGPNSPADLWLNGWAQEGSYSFTPYVGDLNGDFYDDLVVERNDCNWYVAWNNRNGSFTDQGTPILSPWGTSPSPGKYFFWFVNLNTDAKDELLTYDASNGNWYVCTFNTSTNTYDNCTQWTSWGGGIGVFQPLVGDWNGDGKTDLCLRNWSTGNHWVRLSTGTGFSQPSPDNWINWGAAGSSTTFTPLAGDWNGDGKDDILLYNPSTGDWYVRTSNGSAFAYPSGSNNSADRWQAAWTGSGYIPFVGDFNDDGKTDIGLRNPALGDHWVRLSNGLSFTQPNPDNWQAGWGASSSFQLLTGRFGSGGSGGSQALPSPKRETASGPSMPLELFVRSYPNPFNPRTTIHYTLPAASRVTLRIFDLQGRKVATLVDAEQRAGQHEVVWEAQNVASGVYLYRLETPTRSETRKMVLLR